MLRNTTEAMSAILGGCDGVLIKPHNSTFEDVTDFSHRISLNVSNLLKDESYFDKVGDPAGGSYYLENLTEALLNKTLEIFKDIEGQGGFISSFDNNVIQNSIAEVRAKKESEIATRKKVFVGSNKYPNLLESIPYKKEPEKASIIHGMDLLKPQRGIEGFETLRQKTQLMETEIGNRPRVYLACFGNLAMRKARASFASDFFGTAGFEIMGEFFFDSTEEAIQKSADFVADIVVICASDDDYASDGASFAKSFKAQNQDKELVVAGYPVNIMDELKSSGVDSFIHVRTNAIEALSQYQNKVIANSKSIKK
ncbi:UNVERIFIED_CONTAM: hypothetical protein GTU68_003132 [Idotea baltica]|nr:hypothetical protein [Idotea baltica]